MKNVTCVMNKVKFLLCSLTLIGLTQVSLASIVINSESSTSYWGSVPWASDISSTDLINSGQSSLSSSDVDTPTFGAGGTNDGISVYAGSGNTFYYDSGDIFPVVATYNLDTSINTFGYNITSIETFMGWHEHSLQQANQIYTVEVSTVGSSDYTIITTVDYTPFTNVDGSYHYSHVEIDEDSTGILATGIDSIRFTFSSPGLGGSSPGIVIREIDVYGSAAAVPEPASLSALVLGSLWLIRRKRK